VSGDSNFKAGELSQNVNTAYTLVLSHFIIVKCLRTSIFIIFSKHKKANTFWILAFSGLICRFLCEFF